MSAALRGHARRVTWNAVSSVTTRSLEAIAFVVLLPIILRLLGTEQYGLWVLVWAIASLLGLLDLGFGAAVVKFVSDARGRGDPDGLLAVLSTLFWIFVAQAVVVLVAVGVLGASFNRIFSIPPESQVAAQQVFWIVGVAVALRMPLAMAQGVLASYERIWVINAYRAAATLAYVVAVPLVLPRWPDVRVLGLLSLLMSVLPVLACALHVLVRMPELRPRSRHFDWGLVRKLWGFSSAFLVIMVATLIGTRVDTLVIKAALPLSAIAVYGLAMRVAEQASTLCFQGARAWAPVVAQLHGAGDREGLRFIWLLGTKATVAIATPLLVGLMVLAHPLIVHWAGPELAAAAVVLQVLVAAAYISVIHQDSYNMLGMRGDQSLLARSLAGTQLLNLCLSLIFVWKWGLVGVAAATLLAALPFDLGVVMRRLREREGVPVLTFYRRTVLPSVAPGAVMVAAMVAWQEVRPIQSLLEVALVEAGAVLLFLSMFYWWGLDARERAAIRERAWRLGVEALRRRRRRSRPAPP